jgi:hypothetical protein
MEFWPREVLVMELALALGQVPGLELELDEELELGSALGVMVLRHNPHP